MRFEELNIRDQVVLTKDEVFRITKEIFSRPSDLMAYIQAKTISADQAKSIFIAINKLNTSRCICCRVFTFDARSPIAAELEPLIEIAQKTVRMRRY